MVISVKFTILMSSVVCVKLEITSAFTLPVINIPAVVCVKLPSIDEIPTSVPDPMLELVARAFISAVATNNTPPTSARAVSHGFYLDSEALVEQIKNNPEAKKNILKSAKWFLSFLARNTYWNQKYNHNQLRITRVIESLRLLVSNVEADKFYQSVLELIEEDNKVNLDTLIFWKNA